LARRATKNNLQNHDKRRGCNVSAQQVLDEVATEEFLAIKWSNLPLSL